MCRGYERNRIPLTVSVFVSNQSPLLAAQVEPRFAFSFLNTLSGSVSNPDPSWQGAKVLITAILCFRLSALYVCASGWA